MNAISLKDVWLKYRIEFKENGRVILEDFWALKEVNIDFDKGETICIMGENGAGKTTLLKIITGMLKPDRGVVQVNGTVSALMEIGAGFQKDLTGRENIYLISSFFGLTKNQIDACYNDIVKFAAIGKFINAPVKCYSQGMYMRLAFAIAIHVDQDILLVDDLFVVGDLYAQHKCINKMFELKEKGKTIVFVTHDLEMAKRFCQRCILLKDGKMIKDGMLKEVISYYLKTVGDKKGVGILQGEHLGLVFNNGRLILNWDEDSITKEWGGHTSVLSNDNWYPSLQADWELKESSKDRIVLEGKYWDLPISQLWDIKLDGIKNAIDIKIEMDIRECCNFKECKLCFMFSEDYQYWFNPFRKELFKVGDLSKEFSWKCVNSEFPTVNFIGLSAQDKPEVFLPSVILEDELYLRGNLLEIQNTDKIFKARILQSKINCNDANSQTGKHLFFHAKVKVIKDSSMEDSFRQNAPKTMIPKVISDKDNLSLAVDDNNKISLYWKDKKTTSSKGFKAKFYYNGKVYDSSESIWKIHKASDRCVEIIIQWIDSPITQIWNIELLPDGVLLWKVYMEVLERALIRNSEFNVMLSSEYKKWFTSIEEGDITEEINTDDYKNIIMRNDPCGIIGLKGILSNNPELPYALLYDNSKYAKFNSLEKKIDKHSGISDVLGDTEMVTNLYLLNINSKESIEFSKGKYLICDARILISDDFQWKKCIEDIKRGKSQISPLSKKKSLCANEAAIENRQYKFSFIKGRGKLFSKDIEITKGFGIYTSLYSREFNKNGQWYASLDAVWEILSLKRNRLLVKGTWPYLPIIQLWEIKSIDHRVIWKIDMEVFAQTTIERQQVNFMVSDNYYQWSASSQHSGIFPNEFTLLQWDKLYREKGVDRLYISPKNKSTVLPNLRFSCLLKANEFEAIVENSNLTYTSRILEFERIIGKGNGVINPGVYKYFYGKIELL